MALVDRVAGGVIVHNPNATRSPDIYGSVRVTSDARPLHTANPIRIVASKRGDQ